MVGLLMGFWRSEWREMLTALGTQHNALCDWYGLSTYLKGSIIDTTCVSKVTTTSGSQPHVHYKQAKLASSANIQLSPTASPPPCCGHIVGHEPKKEWIMEVYDWWMLWDWLPTYNTSEPLRTRDPLSVRVFFSSVAEEEANVCFSLWGNSSQEIVSPIPLASNSPNI